MSRDPIADCGLRIADSKTEGEGAPAPSSNPQSAIRNPQWKKVIEPPSGWPALNLLEVWRYRDLLTILIWRDISANYRQSVIGYGWALFKSLTQTGVGALVFGVLAGLRSTTDVPYPLFVFVGLLPWMYFSGCLTGASNSLVGASHLLTKVYFPRLILPLTHVGSGLVDFALQFVLLLVVLVCMGRTPGWPFLLAPLFLVACAAAALSVGLWLTALNVKYRDIGHLVPFLAQLWLWLTPVFYPSKVIREKLGGWEVLVGLNPMAGVVEGFRWAVLGGEPPNWGIAALSFGVVAALFVGGLYYFRRMEQTFADVI
jgi:lipopolysaccharide transport system permease protein